uniref:Uncharacterized protein n=1 Tax=Thermosporothrix sp. COM3 TaxID=2490863 RepID=A0A455SML7_9CHLR|nr:hypothetical protein KTC_10650 [Thermosporothrix sp. COM3]
MIAAQIPADPLHTQGRVGHPVHGVELRIVDEECSSLEFGEVGMIEVRTPAMFLGCFQKLEKTAEAL